MRKTADARSIWVTMDGLAGSGKSILACGLGAALRDAGREADVFGEQQLFSRPEFATVADGFRTKRFRGPDDFESAYAAYLAGLGAGAAIFDWSPSGMTGDLPWALADRTAYVAHLRRTTRIDARRRALLLHLVVPATDATRRAIAQRGQAWIDRYDGIARAAGIGGADPFERIVRYAGSMLAPAADERRAAREAGWEVVDIDATEEPDNVLDRALHVIHGSSPSVVRGN